MKVIDTTANNRAIKLLPTEQITSQRLIAALVHKGHSRSEATEQVNHLLDCLEEQLLTARAA